MKSPKKIPARKAKPGFFRRLRLGVLAVYAVFILGIPVALSAFGTVTMKDAGGVTRTYDIILDGSGNFVGMFGVCDGTAAAQCAAVKAASTPPATTDPAIVTSTADGNLIALGARADSAYAGSGSATAIAVLKGMYNVMVNPIATQPPTVSIGAVGIKDAAGSTTGTVKASSTPSVVGDTALVIDQRPNGCVGGHLLSAATDNATNIKASPGTLCELSVINTTTTLVDLRLYDLASAPTCSSATGVIANYPIQANTTSAGMAIPLGPWGKGFALGIGFCLTGATPDNDNTNAVTGVFLNWSYK